MFDLEFQWLEIRSLDQCVEGESQRVRVDTGELPESQTHGDETLPRAPIRFGSNGCNYRIGDSHFVHDGAALDDAVSGG
jgi:hypothetical protein